MFENKVVFVTGGASGLGRVLVEEFIAEGAKVFFTYFKSEQKAQEMKQKYGEKVETMQADASDFEAAQRAVAKCVEVFGTVDVLVNNAFSAKDSSIEKSTVENFDYTIKQVLYPVYNYTKAVTDTMVSNKKGKIISIGSINGIRGREGSIAYSTAKAGIIGFSKTVAKEWGKYDITCNVVAPGYIATEGQTNTSELIKKMVLDECAIRRLTEPVEVANLVLFLASDKANNITGQVYQIDCGQYT